MPRNHRPANLALAVIVALAAAGGAHSQPATPPPAPAPGPTPAPATPAPPPAGEPAKEPSLDELLGLPKKPASPEQPADGAKPPVTDLDKQHLDEKLTAQQAAEALTQAVRQMGETAERIEKISDTGLTTQRLQEDIIRKLDLVIKNSQNQNSSGKSSSPSQQDKDPGEQQQNQQNQKGQKPATEAGKTENKGEVVPPAMQPAQPRANLDAARAAWGALPERLRDIFTQGLDEYYSTFYESLTPTYYRKTAENAAP